MTEAWRPRTLAEALELRAEHPEALVVAGGTDLMVDVNFERTRPSGLIDVSRVPDLLEWERDVDLVSLGAGVTFARIESELDDQVALARAIATVGSPQIRNRATIGGNLATASPAGDAICALAAYDADVVLQSLRGRRVVPWDEFLVGPKRTVLESDELIVGVRWQPAGGPAGFAKVGPRGAMVIAVASACVQLDDELREARIALGSVAPTVVRAREAEAYVTSHRDAADPARAARAAVSACSPIDDLRGSAAYRRRAVEVLVRRLLEWALADRRRTAA